MKILAIEIKLYASWVQSLKEKRMIVKSIVGKLWNKFNGSLGIYTFMISLRNGNHRRKL